jgi:hypothetical protein
VRSDREVELVMHLVRDGLTDVAIARSTFVPRSTVREWRAKGRRRHGAGCPMCDDSARPLRPASYAYLLGLYLGDGYISRLGGAWQLRIFLDRRYPGIIGEACAAILTLRPKNPARLIQREGCVAVSACWKHWPCVFPQHGPGRKHERSIVLTDWQQQIVDDQPDGMLRGLIHSDGWRGTNRVTVGGRSYAYPRYNFDNRSADIRALFCSACDAVGVRWTVMSETTISVARRASVARLDEFVGPKR